MLKTKGKSTIVVSSSGGNKWLQKLSFFSASFIKVDILQLPIVNKSYNLSVSKIKDKYYLNVYSVKFGKENIISVVYK